MKYFDIPTIKSAIERLQGVKGNWLLPAFVFAANDVGTEELVDLSKKKGTDHFLDRYFNGARLNISPFETGNNLLRPRLKDIVWQRGEFAGDYMIRQNTKMWGNLFSSRGYREMRQMGLIEGENAIAGLTESFQARFEEELPESFHFEDFLVWLFAFEGIPDEVQGWADLFQYLLRNELGLSQFKTPYQGRFRLQEPTLPWPKLLSVRPSDQEFVMSLAPKLHAILSAGGGVSERRAIYLPPLNDDDPILARVQSAIKGGDALSFLLAGPPGTGKTRYARQLALRIVEADEERTLFLQFHPALGYDDFMEGFRPVVAESGSGVRYELESRLFLRFAEKAAGDKNRNYVLVIDELNRGDVARIFGEALTYLEPDYRGMDFTLPYSARRVSLPPNLVIVATCNPFDRSVTELDDALLRRFLVIEFEPDAALLRAELEECNVPGEVVNRTLYVFKVLNEALPHGYGHANFLHVKSLDDLAQIWLGRARLTLKRALGYDQRRLSEVLAELDRLTSSESAE